MQHQEDVPNTVLESFVTTEHTTLPPRDRLHQLWLSLRHLSPTNCSKTKDTHTEGNTARTSTRFWTPLPQRRHHFGEQRRRRQSLCTEPADIDCATVVVGENMMIMNTNNCPPEDGSSLHGRGLKSRTFTTSTTKSASSTSSPPTTLSNRLRNFFLQDLRRCKTKLTSGEGEIVMSNVDKDGEGREDSAVELTYWRRREEGEREAEGEKMDTAEDIPLEHNMHDTHPFYQLDVHLKAAQGLLAKDACGTSDPYVKFKIANQIVAKSRTIARSLEPKWDECFVLPIEDIHQPLVLKVYDHDYLLSDDYLGSARIQLTDLELDVPIDLELYLHDSEETVENVDEHWGRIMLTVKVNPKTREERESFYERCKWSSTGSEGTPARKTRPQLWQSVANILLLRGTGFAFEADYALKFKLGNEKYKSKSMCKSITQPEWMERFELYIYPDQNTLLTLGPTLAYQTDWLGKTTIDLAELDKDRPYRLKQTLDGGGGEVCIELMITITGCQQLQQSMDSLNESYRLLCSRYSILRSFSDLKDVGQVWVRIYRAENLAVGDMNGKSDPFCRLELVNEVLQTGTEYKTLCPEWNRTFTLQVRDIHEAVMITVYDEDNRNQAEFLGRVVVPLLSIRSGQIRWMALKDKKLKARAKGSILVQFWLSYNLLKASLRTFTPKETQYIQPEVKFKRSVFLRNVLRLKKCCVELFELGQAIHSCLEWHHPVRSISALVAFLVLVYYFEPFMLPLLVLVMFAKNWTCNQLKMYFDASYHAETIDFIDESTPPEVEDEEEEGEEKKSLKAKFQAIQETTTVVMIVIGQIASFMERVHNTLHFRVPFLSWLGVVSCLLLTITFYFVPLRYLIMAWGVNKFTRRWRVEANSVDNNELADFISRAPDDEECVMFTEYKPNLEDCPGPARAGAFWTVPSDSEGSLDTGDKARKRK